MISNGLYVSLFNTESCECFCIWPSNSRQNIINRSSSRCRHIPWTERWIHTCVNNNLLFLIELCNTTVSLLYCLKCFVIFFHNERTIMLINDNNIDFLSKVFRFEMSLYLLYMYHGNYQLKTSLNMYCLTRQKCK